MSLTSNSDHYHRPEPRRSQANHPRAGVQQELRIRPYLQILWRLYRCLWDDIYRHGILRRWQSGQYLS